MDPGPPRRRRARPVADAPVDALLARAPDLAKGWLLALLEAAPLDDASAILASDLARDGPRLCDAIVRALADDEDLRRLEPGGPLEMLASRVGELAGADGVEATARAVDVLHSVIWSALRAELPGAEADQIAELAERLARVIELVREAALRRSESSGRPAQPAADPRAQPEQPQSATPQPGRPQPEAPRPETHAPEAREPGAAAPSLWRDALDGQIRSSHRTGSPLSLVFAMLEDADRVVAADPGVESQIFGRFAQAVRAVLRRQDILACETDTRAWIIARGTGRAGAQALGARVIRELRDAEPWRGAPLTVSVGVAVLGEDGNDSVSLIDVAEEASYAAAARGLGMVGADWVGGEQSRSGSPEDPGPQLVS